jgi:SAM-dependent methyltransferase
MGTLTLRFFWDAGTDLTSAIMTPWRCPLCGGPRRTRSSRIVHPAVPLVAGVPVVLTATEYQLVDCSRCGAGFKDPPVAEDLLASAYAEASCSNWGSSDADLSRRNFAAVRRALAEHVQVPNPSILDVGCGNGTVVNSLCHGWELFGVEPSLDAASQAEAQGVKIIGRDLGEIAVFPRQFDVVLALDVIEHILDPADFLEKLAAAVSPSGVVIIGTGSRNAWTWRLEGGRYWYCSFVEHVTFLTPKSLVSAGERVGLESISVNRTSHVKASLYEVSRQSTRNIAFLALRCLNLIFPSVTFAGAATGRAPYWSTARDHQLHVFRTQPTSSSGPAIK